MLYEASIVVSAQGDTANHLCLGESKGGFVEEATFDIRVFLIKRKQFAALLGGIHSMWQGI